MVIDQADRVAFRMAVARREAPRTLAVTGVAFGLITLLNSQVGPPMQVAVLFVNLGTALLLIGGSFVMRRPTLPPVVAPWLLGLGALALVMIGLVEVWRSPDAVGFVYLLLIIVIYPTLTLAWTAAGVVAVPMMAGCAVVAFGRFGEAAADWVIATLAAVAVGMALLWLRLRTVDELAEKSALAGQMATRDRLTSALNRHGIEDRIPDLLALAARHQEQVFAVFADVDGLKSVNDRHGHAVGDAVLVATADAIRATVRATDLVGRWGGDEFIVLGLGHIERADELSARIRRNVLTDGLAPELWGGGISVGMAITTLSDVDVEDLIRQADADMYARRRARRARTVADRSP